MTVRLWLLVAECWSCGTNIELTEEQERQIHQLILETARSGADTERHSATKANSVSQPRRRSDPTNHGLRRTSPTDLTVGAVAIPMEEGSAIAHAPPARRRIRASRRRVYRLVDLFRELPAWLVSLIMHLMAVILLALLTLDMSDVRSFITLTTAVHTNPMLGGEVEIASPFADVFDLPIPENMDVNDVAKRAVLLRADQDARDLRLDGVTHNPHLPSVSKVVNQIASANQRQGFAARDPRIRAELIRAEGGTTLTEAAVARGLRWLASHQSADGKWSLNGFQRVPGCNCRNGGLQSDSAGTALALLPFLGAGQTHLVGRYQSTVAQGLRWLLQHQAVNGDLRAGSHDNTGMYAHGQAAIVLCEAFAMTGAEELRDAAQRAIQFIVDAQHERGGWRYQPKQPGDTSILGWQLMALQSARFAGLDVPEETFELADHFLDSCQHDSGARYGYVPGASSTPVMTAEALLCRMYIGWKLDNPALARGSEHLLQHLPSRHEPNAYYWYYATQAMHHIGGDAWTQWNRHMREILVETQETTGHQAGSWTPKGPHADSGGRIYQTALSVCTLEVYYRHLPIFRQLKLD